MAFYLTERWGESHPDAPIEMMRQALTTLEVEEQEHPDVSLTHESCWCLSAFRGRSHVLGDLLIFPDARR